MRRTARVLSPAERSRALALLIALRIGYAYNWFNIGPAFPGIGAAFSVGPAEWGVLLAAFFVAAGAMQVPSGLAARRWGARAVSLWGTTLIGAGAIASGFAPSFAALVAVRAATGVGAALFFSPALGLVGSLYPEGQRGLPVGTFATAFSAGAALGVFGSAVLIAATTWQAAFWLGGAIILALTALAVRFIPPTDDVAPAAASEPREARVPPETRRLLTSPALWAIGFAFVGLEGASFATGQFAAPFGLTTQGWSPALAGAVGAMFLLPSVAGGPVGGPIAERSVRRRTLLVVATIVASVPLALLPWTGVAGALGIAAVFGFFYGFVYAVMYVLPHYLPGIGPREVPIAIGLFNSVQLAGGGAISLAFGVLVALVGYSISWMALAAISVAPLAILRWTPRTGSRAYPTASVAAP